MGTPKIFSLSGRSKSNLGIPKTCGWHLKWGEQSYGTKSLIYGVYTNSQ